MNGRYAIVLKSQLGPKKGFITLQANGEELQGILECLGNAHSFNGKVINSDKIKLEGMLHTPLGEVPFYLTGIVEENMLTAAFIVKSQKYELLGLKVNDKEGN
ncbi:hypothetical protein [Clostridium aminobutyricum]|uniref:Uncharacterized protein n=1 Tax=Clostridium aminobutyricum TaxID=33953 RepID=A0A939D9K1_CLOAM|nr:hypothetical protein [Clostridium aminobutyricum]MBN7773223.1 hypothetical protein [Clostridium aminobutyricum]